jgi:hypothetical protein
MAAFDAVIDQIVADAKEAVAAIKNTNLSKNDKGETVESVSGANDGQKAKACAAAVADYRAELEAAVVAIVSAKV